MKKIKIGISSHTGDILEDFDKAKACNFCTHFVGYGLHAVAGYCNFHEKEIGNGYAGNYNKVAKDCKNFDCLPKFMVENTP